jgi:hypothetical protein
MFPNTALKSISPGVGMMQAFLNIFFLKEDEVSSFHRDLLWVFYGAA